MTDRYGPKFYYLHRENILVQLKEFQQKRGVINPGHINVFRLLATEGKNKLIVFKGRDTCRDNEKFSR